jgi:aspartate aminotransferase-like enzyme
MERIQQNKALGRLPGSLYFDLEENMHYWRNGTYHATPGVQGIYALKRALEMTFERAGGDLPKMFKQHAFNQRALEVGLESIGFVNPVELAKRASVVSVLRTPEGIDAEILRQTLLQVKQVRGQPIAGVEVAAGKRDPQREIRMALLGLWSNKDTVLDACDAMDQVNGNNRLALTAAEQYFTAHQQS